MSTNVENMTGDRERWIGLAHIRPWIGNDMLGDAKAAVVAVVGEAVDRSAFLTLVEAEVRGLRCDLLSLEDVEPLATRMAHHSLPEDFRDAISALSSESKIAYGTFHAYSEPRQA